ncbi:cell division protein ZipA [Thiorhodospira sibirica]|uniref:cell division protein ZipA n=1 Tax=Thiorhodospira sibirica TaxID=154347 RepID=UPI00022C17AF|nr:cell division protein ZipA [Thiorhodospira sibirica]
MDSSLRWLLLGIGLLIMAAIYLVGWLRRVKEKREHDDAALPAADESAQVHIKASDGRREPVLGDAPLEREPEPVAPVTAKSKPSILGRRRRSDADESAAAPIVRAAANPAPAATDPDAPAIKIQIKARAKVKPKAATPDPVAPTPGRKPLAPSPPPREIGKAPTVGITRQEPEKILALHVSAHLTAHFHGADIVRVLRQQGLEYGEMNIFHRMVEHHQQRMTLFSVASMVKPGALNPYEMATFTTPGLALILRLPGPWDGVMAFDAMLVCAEELADELGGLLLDQHREVASRQVLDYTREEIRSWELRLQSSGYA